MKDPDTLYQLRKEQEDIPPASRKLDLTQRQIKALCKGAKEAGYTPVIQVGNMLVRLVPEELAIPPMPGRFVENDDDFKL
ncbi:hypothetical protein [Mesorhizobium sp. CN2-181]|uniref:hypothetical protein n=1 Tax=Mesorhizobium yinganensis TaxID=3157707 RepID=UPI0032B7346B